ncbi:MAG: hypothetical protein WD601_12265, partial [Pseudohongiellaceae bacterium]
MAYQDISRNTALVLSMILLSACGTTLMDDNASSGHLEPPAEDLSEDIPETVAPLPLVTEPQAQEEPDLYTVVAQDVPVRELLF